MIWMQCPKSQIFEWEIPSSTGKGKYTVSKHPSPDSIIVNGLFTCTCKGFIFNKNCKHTKMVESSIAIYTCFFNGTSDMTIKSCPGCGSELVFDYTKLEIGNGDI